MKNIYAISLILGFFTPLVQAEDQSLPYTISNYEEVTDLIEEGKTYYGAVFIDANDENLRTRFVCMTLMFAHNDETKSLDYMYKAWNMNAGWAPEKSELPCEFLSTNPILIENRARCVEEDPALAETRQIQPLETFELDSTGAYKAFRSLSFALTKNYVEQTTPNALDQGAPGHFDPNKPAHAMGRCNARAFPPETLETPVFAANLNSVTVARKSVQGAATKAPLLTLTIQLDLSFMNSGDPRFKNVDYDILLESDQN